MTHPRWMASMSGARSAISGRIIRFPPATLRRGWLGQATSTSTEAGATSPNMEMYGFPPRLPRIGRLIVTVTGPGSLPGDGPGKTTLRGDSLPSTTAAGCLLAATGVGLLDRTGCGLGTLPRWWPGLEARAL